MTGKIRVAVCDDSDVVRSSLASYLAADPQLHLVASFASGGELIQDLEPGSADVVLLDVRMPGLDGPAIAERLAARPDRPKVIYLSSYPEQVPVTDTLDGTVAGALTKDLPPEDLTRAIHLVHDGISLLSHRIRERTEPLATPVPARRGLACDEREQEVLDLLCKGYTNDQIAVRLDRSTSSVKQILGRLSRRAGVRSRTELVLYLMDASFTTR